MARTTRKRPAFGELREAFTRLVGSVGRLFNDEKYSDLTIVCGDRVWPAHKMVVCPQSDFFERACSGNWQEGKDGIIPLPDDDPDVINEMLRYLYTTDYDDEVTKGDGDDEVAVHDPIYFNVLVHTISDKYDIPALEALATSKFTRRAKHEWQTPGFANAIEEMYTVAPGSKKEMQKAALKIAEDHSTELYSKVYVAEFREMAEKCPGFISELYARNIKKKPNLFPGMLKYITRCCEKPFIMLGRKVKARFYCPGCGHAQKSVECSIPDDDPGRDWAGVDMKCWCHHCSHLWVTGHEQEIQTIRCPDCGET